MLIYEDQIAVSVSEVTASRDINALLSLGIRLHAQRENSGVHIGNNYRLALKKSMEFNSPAIHMLDFDRALHWIKRFPKELAEVRKELVTTPGLVLYARTKRAFETHPNIQKLSENTVNAIASEIAGRDVDIMSGSMGMDRETAKVILEKSRCNDYGVYAEFLKIALDHNIPITMVEVEGLEWETPDQYTKEIEKTGYIQWLDEFESLSEWEKRVRLIDDSKDMLISSS